MYRYIITYNIYDKNSRKWGSDKLYNTTLNSKDSHSFALRELEDYIGSFVYYRIRSVILNE